jgi:hypothetical protein
MARVSKSGEWTVNAMRAAVDAAINGAIEPRGLTARPQAASELAVQGGSHAKMRFKGAWMSKDTDLAKRGTILRQGDHPVRVVVHLADSMGFGVMDGKTRSKYERILESIIYAVDTAVEAVSEPAKPLRDDPVGGLES